jgi:hypothetical protein
VQVVKAWHAVDAGDHGFSIEHELRAAVLEYRINAASSSIACARIEAAVCARALGDSPPTPCVRRCQGARSVVRPLAAAFAKS